MKSEKVIIWVSCLFALSLLTASFEASAQDKKGGSKAKKEAKEKKEKKKKVSKEDKAKAQEIGSEALKLYKDGKYKEAIEKFLEENEIVAKPANLYNIARCHQKLGRLAEAYTYFKKYIKTKDKVMLDKAEKYLDEIKSKAEPVNAEAIKLYQEEDYEAALEKFKESYEIVPDPVAYYNVGRCCEKSYQYQEAIKYYQKYIESGHKAKKKKAKQLMKDIENIQGILKVSTEPDGADVFINEEEEKAGSTPFSKEVPAGKYTITVKKNGFWDATREVEILYGEVEDVDISLSALGAPPEAKEDVDVATAETYEETEKAVIDMEPKKSKVPISLGFAVGATVSTSDIIGSFIDGSISLSYRIKQFSVGIGLDNLFFIDSYLLAAYPAGSYTLKVWKDLSLSFAVGFGFAYFHVFNDEQDVNEGFHWDLAAHADIKLQYKVGPILIQVIPVFANVLIGVGSVDPAPLAQFAFLAGIAYDF